MTGFLNSGVPNPLSVITTAAMGDLGYVVNYAASEPYTVANVAGLRAQPSLPQIELGDDILRLPILVVDRRGRVTRLSTTRIGKRRMSSPSSIWGRDGCARSPATLATVYGSEAA